MVKARGPSWLLFGNASVSRPDEARQDKELRDKLRAEQDRAAEP